MTKITFIAPYTEAIETIKEILASMNVPDSIDFEIIHAVGSKKVISKEWNSDIIIARGLTYNAMKKNLKNVQMVPIAVTGYDILKAVKQAVDEFCPRKIAIILAEGIDVDVNFIKKIFDIEVDFYAVSSEQAVEEIYQKIKMSHSHDALVGGLTVYKYALMDNYNMVRVHTGVEAIRLAIRESITAVNAMHGERRKNQLLNTIMETLEEGVIAVDSQNNIYSMNDVARKMFSIFDTNIAGKNAFDYIPKKIFERDEDEDFESSIKKINNQNMLIKYRPLIVDGMDEGLVLNLVYVDNLQKTEIDIRKKLNSRGLVAKYSFKDILGKSPAITKTITMAEKYASTDSDVLIIGETGTGKELFAQSIHNNSKRAKYPFVALNCAAINDNLLESELFGYTEGAFTGAVKGGKTGLFELAHKGTLFMDEIGELPLSLQAKLLRVLQEKEIRKLGDDKIIPVDVRIVAATNVNLHKMADEGGFRQDLLYRLDILNLSIPPLRARREDIEELAKGFISQYDFNGIPIDIDSDAVKLMMEYKWKGNIRELRNICERLCVLNTSGIITRENVDEVLSNSFYKYEYNQTEGKENIINNSFDLPDTEKRITMDEMAKSMGISRTTLWRRMKQEKSKNNK